MLTITQDTNFDIDDELDLEKELIMNVLENVKICQRFYMIIYDFYACSFKEYILRNPSYIMGSISKEMNLDWEKEN